VTPLLERPTTVTPSSLSCALALALSSLGLGCDIAPPVAHDHEADDASGEFASEDIRERDTPEYLAAGVRPGMSNPWASATHYPATMLDVELDAEQRAMLDEYNWRTGERFTEREIARLAYLHRQLPGNSTLMPFDPDARARQARRHEQNRALAHVLDSAEASAEQISSYYAFKQRHYLDRIELIEFVLSEPFWDPGTHRRYRRSKQTAQLELDKIQAQHQQALRAHARRQGGR